MVKVVPIGLAEAAKPKRLGFLEGMFKIPDDFDRVAEDEIAGLFGETS
jgi:hypothetical protein